MGRTSSTKLPRARRSDLERLLSVRSPDPLAVESLDIELVDAILPKDIARGMRRLSPVRRRYLSGSIFVTEVNNGGTNQFFANWGPDVVREAVAFFEARKQRKVTGLLRRAIKALPGGRLPRTRAAMYNAVSDPKISPGIDRAHEKLTDSYFAANLSPLLRRECLEHVGEHADEFFR